MSDTDNEEMPVDDIGGFDIDVPMPDIPEPEESTVKDVEDEVDVAYKFAFIGSGQGGSRLAETFYKIGYRRVCAINTAAQDMKAIDIPAENKMLIADVGGAGKQPAVAREIYDKQKEDVLDLMRRSFGSSVERTFICVGAGGGTGAGTVTPLVDTAKELQIALKSESKKVGVIVALPKKSEGAKAHENAYFVINSLVKKVKSGDISPLIIIDNERISEVYPNTSVSNFYPTANRSVASLFHLFNSLAARESSHVSFDKNDYRTILDSGVMVYGATPVTKWKDATAISYAVRENLKKNVLTGGVDLSTASVAGAVIIGSPSILGDINMRDCDHAFEQLTRIMNGGTVHQGIYTGRTDKLIVYTAVGGLEPPASKINELREIGHVGVAYDDGKGAILGEV